MMKAETKFTNETNRRKQKNTERCNQCNPN